MSSGMKKVKKPPPLPLILPVEDPVHQPASQSEIFLFRPR